MSSIYYGWIYAHWDQKKAVYSCDNIYDSLEYFQLNAERRRGEKKKCEVNNRKIRALYANWWKERAMMGNNGCADEEKSYFKIETRVLHASVLFSYHFFFFVTGFLFVVPCQFLCFSIFILLAFHDAYRCVPRHLSRVSQMTFVNNEPTWF